MIPKERIAESVELLRTFLIHHHNEGDDNSLYVRFAEIMSNYGDMNWRLDLYDNATKAIEDYKNDHSISN